MAINTRNGMLYFDFKFNGQRCREYTKLKDTTANRKKMQKVMDAYAGGISSHYQFNENCLNLAKEKINNLITLSGQLSAQDYHELMFYYELKERLTICLTLIEHLKARKETRWHSFAENLDHPQKSDDWKKYVNTKKVDGKIKVILRELVKEDEYYEHQN